MARLQNYTDRRPGYWVRRIHPNLVKTQAFSLCVQSANGDLLNNILLTDGSQ